MQANNVTELLNLIQGHEQMGKKSHFMNHVRAWFFSKRGKGACVIILTRCWLQLAHDYCQVQLILFKVENNKK